MSDTAPKIAELGAIALAAGFTLWVLAVQPLFLVRTMPRPRFLGLQMRIVRAWIRVVAGLAALVLAAALPRTGLTPWLAPPLVAFFAALIAAGWAVPRALQAGGAAIGERDGGELSEAGFLLDGGGATTRLWHRVVLACVALLLAGMALDAYGILRPRPVVGASSDRGPVEARPTMPPPAPAPPLPQPQPQPQRPSSPDAGSARAVAPPATAAAIVAFERQAAILLGAGGRGSTAPLRAAWQHIFTSCTMRGEAHERLHVFLVPIIPELDRVDAATDAGRLPALRAIVRQLASFDERFTVGD